MGRHHNNCFVRFLAVLYFSFKTMMGVNKMDSLSSFGTVFLGGIRLIQNDRNSHSLTDHFVFE